MQSIPFYIAYLLTRHECVIVPDLGAFVVFPSDKEKNKWGVLSPPENLLEFYTEINHNDGLLSFSITKVEKCSAEEADSLISQFVSNTLLALDQGKTVNIPWVGSLYLENNNILFRPENILSCNALNYGLTGFSMPCLTELIQVKQKEELIEPDEEEDLNEHKEVELQNTQREQFQQKLQKEQFQQKFQREQFQQKFQKEKFQQKFQKERQGQENLKRPVPVKKEDKNKDFFSIPISRKLIIYTGSIVAALLAIIFIPTTLNNVNFTPDQTIFASIIGFSKQDTIYEEINDSEDIIETQAEQSITLVEEKPVQNMEVTSNKDTTDKIEAQNQKKADDFYYYNIISSLADVQSAKISLTAVQFKGFKNAAIILSGGKYRIYTDRFDNKEEAEKYLKQFRKDYPAYPNAWILKEK